MKSHIINFILLISLIAAFASCKSEQQKLVEQIDGTWQIIDINLIEPVTDNVDLPESGTIKFEKCKIGKNNMQFCEGNYLFNGNQAQSFQYQSGNVGEELEAINILQSDLLVPLNYNLGGHYKVNNLDKNNVTLEGNILLVDDTGENKSYHATFILKK